jgi:acylphosphatase
MAEDSRARIRITGVVQGVGFRHFARKLAQSYGIKGNVRNAPDGSVQITAEGRKEALMAFIDELKIGPRFASVSRIDVDWQEASGEFMDFTYAF